MATEPGKDKPGDSTGSSSSSSSSAGQTLAANVKWIVAGVIAVVGMVLFKEPLTQLLNRAENVEITTSGVKVSTVKTPLGETVVSNKGLQPVAAAGSTGPAGQAPGNGFQTTRDTEAGFAISWPANGRWSSQPEAARQFGARLVLANPTASRGDFVPNVNVVVTNDAAGMDVAQYLSATARILTGLGWEVSAQQADSATQSGVLVTVNRQMGTAQIQRVVLRNGVSYVITASRANGDTREDLYAAMGQILNSFELI